VTEARADEILYIVHFRRRRARYVTVSWPVRQLRL